MNETDFDFEECEYEPEPPIELCETCGQPLEYQFDAGWLKHTDCVAPGYSTIEEWADAEDWEADIEAAKRRHEEERIADDAKAEEWLSWQPTPKQAAKIEQFDEKLRRSEDR